MAYCTQTQVEQRLQINFTDDADPVVAELIAAAGGHIDRVIGRNVEQAARSETFDPPDNPNVWLTHTPVDSASTSTAFTVTVDGDALAATAYSVDEDTGRLTRVTNGRPRSWSIHKLQSIVVDYLGGYATVPYDIQDICAYAAARAFDAGASFASQPAAAQSVKQVALQGSDSVTFVDVEAALRAMHLTEDEVDALRVYRNSVVA